VQALEAMARAAAVALENTRLRHDLSQALIESRAADEAKNAFLASMSREMRGPLGGVASLVDMLARTQLDPRQQQLCAVLKTSAQDVVQLVGDILDFARLEAGRSNFYAVRFNFAEIVRDAAAPFAEQAAARGLSFDLAIPDEALGFFMGDDMRVKQIVQNLVSNAVKFTDKGGVRVVIGEEDRVGVRSIFRIAVSDTGLGFDASTSAALFDRFAQGEGAAGRGGVGLGLAMAETLARGMGGDITATSEKGGGSTFTVRLPLERAPDDFVTDRHFAAKHSA
jgi:signal transduction histidine kinase